MMIEFTDKEVSALKEFLDDNDIFNYINWDIPDCPYRTMYDKIADEPAETWRDGETK